LPCKRDLIFAAVADEEQGCALGSCHLVDEQPELVRAEYMLGEVGGFSLQLFGQTFYPIQVAEKGFCWVRGSVRGTAGHGSMPDTQSAVHQLSDAVQRLAQRRFPPHVTQPFQAFLQHLSAHAPPLVSKILPHLASERLGPWLLAGLLRSPRRRRAFAALQSNTASVTVLRAGSQTNVIPGHAELEIDGRMLPGQTQAAFLGELRAIVGEQLDLEVIRSLPAVVSPVDTPLFSHLGRMIRRHDPEGIPIPYMIPGFTDAKAFSQLGTKCYGFSPVRFPPEDEIFFSELYHGVDERIPVEGFKWGLRVLWDAVAEFCI
jgi:acetylornithine deacetylase/succinyl-diaminopimelate desuccinylase-like protein